jgi:hypothetical protein
VGDDRFLQVVLRNAQAPCRRIVSEVLRELRRFSGDEVQSDDITLLLARWSGAPVEGDGSEVPPEAALRAVPPAS